MNPLAELEVWFVAGTQEMYGGAVIAAVEAGQTIWIAEGEKDVHALEAAGVVATCSPGGAGKWRDEYAE